jgi:hypothetical protein
LMCCFWQYVSKLDSPLRTLQNCDPWSVRISRGLAYSPIALSSYQITFSVVPSLKSSDAHKC